MVRRIGVGSPPAALAVTGTGVWLSHPADDAITFVDAEREAVTRTVHVPGRPYALAAADGGVWVAQSAASALTLVAADGTPGEPLTVGRHPLGLAAGDGSTVWATLSGDAAPAEAPTAALERGGTLRVIAEQVEPGDLDPHWHPTPVTAELGRCCLHRTLLSYSGRPAADGGTLLRPDLAVDQPEVSADGLTWTFSLRRGLRYAPPYDDVEVTAGDVVRSLERMIRPAPEGVEPGARRATVRARAPTRTSSATTSSSPARPTRSPASRRRTTTRWSSAWSARAASSATCSRSR